MAEFRLCAQDRTRFVHRVGEDGSHRFELIGTVGRLMGRSPGCSSRAGVAAGIASVQRNAAAQSFRGLVRRDISFG